MRSYPPSTIYRYLDLPLSQRIQTHNTHKHNTTPTLTDLSPSHPPTRPNTTHTTATNTLTHIPLYPCSSRIGKTQIQSCHSPPNTCHPARAKHMSHTPPTPLTTLISITPDALDKTHEQRVPPIYVLTTTTPPPDPTPAFPSPSHPNILSTYTHATQTTVHASQSMQQPHPQHRIPRQTSQTD